MSLFLFNRRDNINEVIEKEQIESLIYEIRGVEVMLDSDLAILYGCSNGTKTINQSVKRHINKFPERYMFQLTEDEFLNICGPNLGPQVSKSRTLPHVFTEQGVAMLATVLHTKVADEISMKIIDAFVYLRKYLSNDSKNNILINHEERILKLEESFNKFSSKEKTIIYEGKIYDAYSILLDIFNDAKNEIIIIDNYANKELLDTLRNMDKRIIIFTNNIDKELKKKYEKQYTNITFKNNNPFHDRYIILDRKEVYISGMSLKDIGKGYSYINKENEKIFIDELLKRVINLINN